MAFHAVFQFDARQRVEAQLIQGPIGIEFGSGSPQDSCYLFANVGLDDRLTFFSCRMQECFPKLASLFSPLLLDAACADKR
jgi:hypothetical protein